MRAATVAASTSGSRSTTGSPTAATSPGSGTPTSSCWPARSATWPARAPGPPRWRCASSTPGCRRRRSRSRRRSTRSLDRARRRRRRRALRPAHLHGPARAPHPARQARPRAEGTGRERQAAVWHEVECGGYAADLPVWERLADAADGPVLELGCGTGRVALHLAASRARGLGRRCRRLPARGAPGAGGGAGAFGARRRAPTFGPWTLDRDFELILAPMQLLQMLGSASGAPRGSGAGGGPPRARGPSRGRDRRAPPPPRWTALPLPFPTSGSSTAGSTRAFRSRRVTAGGDLEIHRRRQAVSPDGALSEEEHIGPPRRPGRRRARGRGRDAGPAAGGPARGAAPRTATSAPPSCSWSGPDGAPRRRALPRADEHLRRPRQHPVPAAALRVARDRLLLRRRGAGRAARPGAPTT